MNNALVCWKCGASLADLPLPLGHRAECLACHAEQHVCRLCRHYDPAKSKQCREPAAEVVTDKSRANFCDWFQPRPGAYVAAKNGDSMARTKLDALFAGGS